MTTKQMYYLVTIAEFGNLSKAAQVLNISQPALSKFLAQYEDSIGFLLFLRHRKTLTPTAVGRYLIECAQKILNEQTRMLQTIRSVTGNEHSRIRLATAPNRGAIIYSHIYSAFSKKYPNISLSLTELYANEQPSAVLHGQIDLALGAGAYSDKITDIPIAYEELLVSLPISHPLAKEEHIRLSDLKDTPFVLQGPRHSIRILSDQLFEEAGFKPVVAFESNDVILVDSMLHQAVGAGLVTKVHVFPCEELAYRPLDPPVHQTLHIRYPRNHTLTEPERYLAGLLIQERLSDPRYQPIHSPESEEFLQFLEELNHSVQAPTIPDAIVSAKGNTSQINLDSQLLRYILSIIDEKSLTMAAEKNYLAQPALSRHLRNMENMLGTPLFTRVHNKLEPNNAGKVFANFARNILQIEAEMDAHVRNYKKGHGGGLYMQCDPSVEPFLQEYFLPVFHARYPDITLNITSTAKADMEEALLNASTDLGLYFTCDPTHPVLHKQTVLKQEMLYFASPSANPGTVPDLSSGAGDADKPQQSIPKSLQGLPFMLTVKGTSIREAQEYLLSTLFEGKPEIVCEARLSIIQKLTALGVADTILPLTGQLPEAAAAQGLHFQPPQYIYFVLASHPSRTLPVSVSTLAEILAELIQ